MVDPEETFMALDFDQTIIDGNADWVVQELGEIPQELRTAAPSDGFTQFMDNVFVHLRKNHGVTKEMLIEKVLTVPLAPGMQDLMKFLAQPSRSKEAFVESFIVSDANTEFVKASLEKYKLDQLIPMQKVYTNHAYVDEEGGLRVKPFLPKGLDGSKPHNCPLCPPNLCKGDVVDNLRKNRTGQGRTVKMAFYVGDGHNDFCPSIRLKETDVVFCRVGFKLEPKLREELKLKWEERRLRAKVVFYSDAKEIVEEMKTHLSV